jgi:peptidoglycan hydrolase CwlO-like protein
LPPTAADVEYLRSMIETLKKSKDADLERIAKLEARVETAEKQLATARENVRKTGLLDLF